MQQIIYLPKSKNKDPWIDQPGHFVIVGATYVAPAPHRDREIDREEREREREKDAPNFGYSATKL